MRYILGIPTPQTPALSFGITMHSVMRRMYEMLQTKEKITLSLARQLLDHYWIHEGYSSKAYESEMKKRGERYIDEYLKKEFKPQTSILALEQPFTIPIVAHGRSIRIGGKIDRIDACKDGGIEIIDYKTGRMPTKRDVDANLQLSMYAIAVSEMKGTAFLRPVDKITLTLYFFDSQEKISTTRTVQQLIVEKEKIIETANEIETSSFQCLGNQLCANCEYSLFCNISV